MRMKTLRPARNRGDEAEPSRLPSIARADSPHYRRIDLDASGVILVGHEVVTISGPRRVPGGVLLRLTAFYLK